MKIFIKLGIILVSMFGIVSCTPQMTRNFWNGYYSDKKAVEEYNKREETYYAKETPEQQILRKKNHYYCETISEKRYPPSKIFEGNNFSKSNRLYISCMEERGSPIYRGGK